MFILTDTVGRRRAQRNKIPNRSLQGGAVQRAPYLLQRRVLTSKRPAHSTHYTLRGSRYGARCTATPCSDLLEILLR